MGRRKGTRKKSFLKGRKERVGEKLRGKLRQMEG